MEMKVPSVPVPLMLYDPTLQTIESLSHATFTQVLDESESGESTSKIVKVGDLSYKILTKQDHLDSLKQRTLNSVSENVFGSNDDLIETYSHKALSEARSEPGDSNLQQGVHPGVSVVLKVLDSDHFLSKLPSSLRSFIEETIDVIRTRDVFTQKTQYSFTFSKLNLSIMLQQVDGGLDVSISLLDEKMKALFTDETRELLFNALKEAFPDEKIEVSFVEEGTFANNDQADKESTRDSPPDEEFSDDDSE